MDTTHTTKKMAGNALLSGGLALAALAMATGTAHAFNPQPDPPGKPITISNPAPVAQGQLSQLTSFALQNQIQTQTQQLNDLSNILKQLGQPPASNFK
ncbi:hypothetical protein [Mycolicibacterium moriokaense]|uniref:Uncharacterized protein n=1 Tax=Mycolicibacterium moriokaense TaxID=39691 RepID=A0A318GWW9_9MYCO|nr:hypothetical protein [Mycolicibacterium moriokaense]PXW93632.1 hypothetical protein C8E89_1821 [Mycolicibacterium moriokaense]